MVAVITAAIVGFGIPLWMLYPYIIMTRKTREGITESHLHTYFEYLLDDGGEDGGDGDAVAGTIAIHDY